jgi:hypothetical protein
MRFIPLFCAGSHLVPWSSAGSRAGLQFVVDIQQDTWTWQSVWLWLGTRGLSSLACSCTQVTAPDKRRSWRPGCLPPGFPELRDLPLLFWNGHRANAKHACALSRLGLLPRQCGRTPASRLLRLLAEAWQCPSRAPACAPASLKEPSSLTLERRPGPCPISSLDTGWAVTR